MPQTMLLTSTVNTQNEIRPATIVTINMFIAFDQPINSSISRGITSELSEPSRVETP